MPVVPPVVRVVPGTHIGYLVCHFMILKLAELHEEMALAALYQSCIYGVGWLFKLRRVCRQVL